MQGCYCRGNPLKGYTNWQSFHAHWKKWKDTCNSFKMLILHHNYAKLRCDSLIASHVCQIRDSQPKALVPKRVCWIVCGLQKTKTKFNLWFLWRKKRKKIQRIISKLLLQINNWNHNVMQLRVHKNYIASRQINWTESLKVRIKVKVSRADEGQFLESASGVSFSQLIFYSYHINNLTLLALQYMDQEAHEKYVRLRRRQLLFQSLRHILKLSVRFNSVWADIHY